jgi:hypothetical protein
MKCAGIFGAIFGHSFSPVFDITEEASSAEDLQKKLKAIEIYNSSVSMENEITPSMKSLLKKTTKVYQTHVCKRCGRTSGDANKPGIEIS